MKLGVIGFGRMGSSIVKGIIKSEILTRNDIIIFEVNEEVKSKIIKDGLHIASSIEEVIAKSQNILLSVKPQIFKNLRQEFGYINVNDKVIISIMAGINVDNLKEVFGENNKFVLAMPNTPSLIGYGTTVIASTNDVNQHEFQFVDLIFRSLGEVEYVSSSLMNEIIPASGSFPAYVYYFVESFASSINELGVDKKLAVKLLTSTLIGAAKMIELSNKDVNNLIDDVCSPNGATIEGIKVFDDNNLKSIIDLAVNACVKRAKELGK